MPIVFPNQEASKKYKEQLAIFSEYQSTHPLHAITALASIQEHFYNLIDNNEFLQKNSDDVISCHVSALHGAVTHYAASKSIVVQSTARNILQQMHQALASETNKPQHPKASLTTSSLFTPIKNNSTNHQSVTPQTMQQQSLISVASSDSLSAHSDHAAEDDYKLNLTQVANHIHKLFLGKQQKAIETYTHDSNPLVRFIAFLYYEANEQKYIDEARALLDDLATITKKDAAQLTSAVEQRNKVPPIDQLSTYNTNPLIKIIKGIREETSTLTNAEYKEQQRAQSTLER